MTSNEKKTALWGIVALILIWLLGKSGSDKGGGQTTVVSTKIGSGPGAYSTAPTTTYYPSGDCCS